VLTVEESIVINKPRLEVWEFMTDPANVPVYSSNVVEYELVSGEKQEVGRICRWVVKVAGRRLEMTDEMVEVERGRGGKYKSKDATIPYSLSVHCEDEGEGTKVTWHQEMESLKGFFKFADPIVLKLYAHDVRSYLGGEDHLGVLRERRSRPTARSSACADDALR
jgi:carbon monoxide dehydrogenase subunit G